VQERHEKGTEGRKEKKNKGKNTKKKQFVSIEWPPHD